MVLTKEELISALKGEVNILVHLLSKTKPEDLEYRPSAQQRSALELLQYLAVMPGIHLRGILWESFDVAAWRAAWTNGLAASEALDFDGLKSMVAGQAADLESLLAPCDEAALRMEIEMFGRKASRGATIVRLVLSHYAAYRMQLFLYLKAAGHAELATMNLWAGRDPA
jgi:2-methylcitrate dehydratase PrpD